MYCNVGAVVRLWSCLQVEGEHNHEDRQQQVRLTCVLSCDSPWIYARLIYFCQVAQSGNPGSTNSAHLHHFGFLAIENCSGCALRLPMLPLGFVARAAGTPRSRGGLRLFICTYLRRSISETPLHRTPISSSTSRKMLENSFNV